MMKKVIKNSDLNHDRNVDSSGNVIHKDRIYNTLETAALVGVSKFTLEKWRSGDRIEGPSFVRMGRRNIKYRGADLLAFIDAKTVTPEAA